MFRDAQYKTGTGVIPPGGALLLFADGLTDSIPGENAEDRLRDALARKPDGTMSYLKSLMDAKLNEDDITILLVRRTELKVSRCAWS